MEDRNVSPSYKHVQRSAQHACRGLAGIGASTGILSSSSPAQLSHNHSQPSSRGRLPPTGGAMRGTTHCIHDAIVIVECGMYSMPQTARVCCAQSSTCTHKLFESQHRRCTLQSLSFIRVRRAPSKNNHATARTSVGWGRWWSCSHRLGELAGAGGGLGGLRYQPHGEPAPTSPWVCGTPTRQPCQDDKTSLVNFATF